MKVTGEGRIRESITRRQKAASVASVGSVCDLNLKIPGKRRQTRTVSANADETWSAKLYVVLHKRVLGLKKGFML